jgi:excisionase family DNA binding protein
VAEQPPTDGRVTERLTVSQAATRLGITESAVRGRINRGTLEAERVGGTVYVLLSAEQSADSQQITGDYPGEYNALTSALEARIESLERQLEEARERDRENRRLLAAALERIPPQLEAPSEPRESPETATEGEVEPPRPGSQEGAQRPWWSRWFGG